METKQILGTEFQKFCNLVETTILNKDRDGLSINNPTQALQIIQICKSACKANVEKIQKALETKEIVSISAVMSIRDRVIALNQYSDIITQSIENEQKEVQNVLKEIISLL